MSPVFITILARLAALGFFAASVILFAAYGYALAKGDDKRGERACLRLGIASAAAGYLLMVFA